MGKYAHAGRPPHKRNETEREYGKPIDEVLLQVLNEQQTPFRAAVALGWYPNGITYWIQRCGISKTADGTWVKAEGAQHDAN